jgi:hypothetical protein
MKVFRKGRRIGVKTLILIPILIITFISISILGITLLKNVEKSNTRLVLEVAEVSAKYAASHVDGNKLANITVGSEDSVEYKIIHKNLSEVLRNTPILYAYTMYTVNENGEKSIRTEEIAVIASCVPVVENIKYTISGQNITFTWTCPYFIILL